MRTLLGWLLVLGGASLASAQTPIPLSVSGNQAQGTVMLPGGVTADVTISFESVVGLSPSALTATATLVSPADPDLLVRLPQLANVPSAFPVDFRFGPAPLSTLAFAGLVTVSLHTANLELDRAVPFSLYKSPAGGAFQDITTAEASGSYRVSGSSGSFSEFLIVNDNQPVAAVVAGKFAALQSTLTANAGSMPLTVAADLQALLSQAVASYDGGAIQDAVSTLTAFDAYVQLHSGQDIPSVWRANDPATVDVAGLLRSAARTLAFSLSRMANG